MKKTTIKRPVALGLSLTLLLSTQVTHTRTDAAHAILQKVDGLFIDADSVTEIIGLCQNISALQHGYGHRDPQTKKREPNCYFKGAQLSPHELEKFENEHLAGTRSMDEATLHELHAQLEHCKSYFIEMTAEFLEEARMMKDFLTKLIDEWCKENDRSDSLLLRWMALEGNEVEMFEKNVLTFKDFNQFCTDLYNFQHDLIQSCTKACQAWEKLMGRTLPWNKKK